jgi:hypothetical protein
MSVAKALVSVRTVPPAVIASALPLPGASGSPGLSGLASRLTDDFQSPSKSTAVHFHGLHPYANKMPSPAKTDNDSMNRELNDLRDMSQTLISEILQDSALARHLFLTMQRFKREQTVATSAVDASERFSKHASLGTVDEAWLIDFLASKSDMASTDIVESKKQDIKNPQHLLAMATNCSVQAALPACCGIKDVYRRVMDELICKNSNPLAHWKSGGGVVAGGMNWKCGIFVPTFEDGVLVAILHRPTGDKVVVPLEKSIRQGEYLLDENWSNRNAHFEKPPFPKVKLEIFFSKKTPLTGPWKQPSMKPKAFQELCERHHTDWQRVRASTSQANVNTNTTSVELKKVSADKRRVSMDESKAKAMDTMQAKKKLRVIQCQEL